MLEHKAYDVEVASGDAGTAEAYVAVFGNVDRQGEIIAPGAFKNLDTFVRDGWIAVNHEWDDLPVASVNSAIQDERGLKLAWDWHGTDDAQAARTVCKERMERGKAVKCSIGFRVTADHQEERDGRVVRVLDEIELYEASIVNLPANPRAEVVGVKAWHEDYSEAMAALKEGRVLSSRNRARLTSMCERLREAASDLERMLAETDPTPSGEDSGWTEKPKAADATSVVAALEANRARFPVLLTGSLQ